MFSNSKSARRLALTALSLFVFAASSGVALAETASSNDAVGSWFGRAAAVPGGTICPPLSPGCPVPPEIIMVFTVNADGTFIGIDSNIFVGGSHSTAHGEWTRATNRSIQAAFTLLQ